MLAKMKKNMFMSFRDDPRDIQTISDEIELNVRRGLDRLKRDTQREDSTMNITRQLSDLAIEEMTSIDFCKDIRSHYRTHEYRLRDVIYTKKCWDAICGNSHLFKDKVFEKLIFFFAKFLKLLH